MRSDLETHGPTLRALVTERVIEKTPANIKTLAIIRNIRDTTKSNAAAIENYNKKLTSDPASVFKTECDGVVKFMAELAAGKMVLPTNLSFAAFKNLLAGIVADAKMNGIVIQKIDDIDGKYTAYAGKNRLTDQVTLRAGRGVAAAGPVKPLSLVFREYNGSGAYSAEVEWGLKTF
jgi:hypothetical protein